MPESQVWGREPASSPGARQGAGSESQRAATSPARTLYRCPSHIFPRAMPVQVYRGRSGHGRRPTPTSKWGVEAAVRPMSSSQTLSLGKVEHLSPMSFPSTPLGSVAQRLTARYEIHAPPRSGAGAALLRRAGPHMTPSAGSRVAAYHHSSAGRASHLASSPQKLALVALKSRIEEWTLPPSCLTASRTHIWGFGVV